MWEQISSMYFNLRKRPHLWPLCSCVCKWKEPGNSVLSKDSSDVSLELTANASVHTTVLTTVHTTGANLRGDKVALLFQRHVVESCDVSKSQGRGSASTRTLLHWQKIADKRYFVVIERPVLKFLNVCRSRSHSELQLQVWRHLGCVCHRSHHSNHMMCTICGLIFP